MVVSSESAGSAITGYSAAPPRLDVDHFGMMRSISELREGPIPTILDTSCVRTGLHYQLENSRLPASVAAAQSGRIRLFMELDALNETWTRLPRFAGQLNVPLATLQRMFAKDWLPLLSIVSLPDTLRQLDKRASAVRDLDWDDYPTAALAALLSPCILLTHNHRHFRPLDVRKPSQGVDGVFAAIDVKASESHVQGIMLVPATPVVAVGATTKWAADRVGSMAWVALAILIVGGVVLYWRQPVERKERIKQVASETGKLILDEYTSAMFVLQQAQDQLGAYVIPAPEDRSANSAVVRKLAVADDSMSAQQLRDILDESVRPAVDPLRRFLHGNKSTVFREARRGSFVLGGRYQIAQFS
jgi:hypothetical protein